MAGPNHPQGVRGTTFETLTYAYDANGNRTTLTDATGTTTFGYDALNRLTSAAYPGTYGTWSWSYDAVGNRLTQNSPSGQTNYGYDANNRLTSVGSTTYSYDANGNLTSISTGTSFTYDAHNRLSQANLPGGLVVQYTYNGDGLKIRRIEGATTTRYYHDGIRPLYETKADGSRNADPERDIFGNLLARQDAGGVRYYYHHDGLGSTVGLTDASGAVAAQRSYDAWGNRRTSSGSAPGNYQFTGAELDPTSGLYHMGARFYDPTIGRWLSEDAIQDDYFDPASLNLYTYIANNPVVFVDIDGQSISIPLTNPYMLIATALALIAAYLTGQELAGLIINLAQREKKQVAGTAGRLAEHLADYLGRPVGGRGPRYKDAKGSKKILEQAKGFFKDIWEKVGRDVNKLRKWLRDEGWTDEEIDDLLKALRDAGVI